MAKLKDLIGQKFGRLTVIKRVENDKYGSSQWLCKCDCGNEKIFKGYNLKPNGTQSCGCLLKEVASKLFKKYNTYDLTGEYGVGHTEEGEEFYFDLEDYDLIKDYCWYVTNSGYIEAKDICDNSKNIRMHRLVMNCPDGFDIDHVKHCTWDNRKEFLRITTRSQNCMNQKISKNNTSGVKGINWDNKINKWKARISINGKETHIGCFEDINDAIRARLEAELIYYKEYRYIP